MPIREFRCSSCRNVFETLVLGPGDRSELCCPDCGSRKLRQLFSVFGVAGTEKKVKAASHNCGSCSSRSCSTCG
ncbi:zinc ribbon domain-containing protein [candidate division WOR-3 bacterium]|nr:zinc ribbon domain-containing protein [candidate division WOR-3 bacterium]